MFWDIPSLTAAHQLAEQHLGPTGRYVESLDGKFIGVTLYTRQAGRFWYGDINFPKEKNGVQQIAKALKETVYILPELSISDDRPLHQRALAEVST